MLLDHVCAQPYISLTALLILTGVRNIPLATQEIINYYYYGVIPLDLEMYPNRSRWRSVESRRSNSGKLFERSCQASLLGSACAWLEPDLAQYQWPVLPARRAPA